MMKTPFLQRLSQDLSKWFCWIGGIALLLLTGIACVNMLMRSLGAPLTGAYELIPRNIAIDQNQIKKRGSLSPSSSILRPSK